MSEYKSLFAIKKRKNNQISLYELRGLAPSSIVFEVLGLLLVVIFRNIKVVQEYN
jgi:hypothetical protein